MLTLKSAHTLHPAVYVRKCGLRAIFILQFCQKLFFIDFIIVYLNIFKDGSS